MELINELKQIDSSATLLEKLSDPGLSNYVICWMRLVASAELQKPPDFYINFLPNVVSVHDFCRQVNSVGGPNQKLVFDWSGSTNR